MTTRITSTSSEDWIARLAAIDDMLLASAGGRRVGEICLVCDTVIPSYALECDGSTVSRTTYADLYAILGDIYGSGDGSTTFGIPDYRGWFIRSLDHGTGVDQDAGNRAARPDGNAQAAMPGTWQGQWHASHHHSMYRPTNNRTGGGGNNVNGSGTNISSQSQGGNEFRPVNVNIFYCIVFEAGG